MRRTVERGPAKHRKSKATSTPARLSSSERKVVIKVKFKTCPDCKSSLDHGEKCDCKKKETAPMPRGQSQRKKSTTHILSTESSSVNPTAAVDLSDLIFPTPVMDKELVAAVQEAHGKYDKTLHSKCKRGEDYGIQLRPSAIDAICRKLGAKVPTDMPAQVVTKLRKPDNRTLPCRITCRLSEDEYGMLQLLIRRDGHATMQDWLLQYVRQYITGAATRGDLKNRKGNSQ